MANPATALLYFEDMQTMASTMLGGQSVDPTLFTQYLSDSRTDLEQDRDWNVLRTVDSSIGWSNADTWQTAHSLAGLTVPFVRWVEDNAIQVWDGNTTNPTILPVTIIPYDERLWSYSTQFTAALDYTTMNLYFMGKAGQQWTVLLTYIGDYGDIVQKSSNGNVATTWAQFPARFHKYLPFDVVARYRMGVSYDDLAARNADQNFKDAQAIKRTMQKWDANLTRSLLRNRDYLPQDMPTFVSRKINITNG